MQDTRFVIVRVAEKYDRNDGLWGHPLQNGVPPEWAEEWGDSSKYGPFVGVNGLRFLWHPYNNFWFCEVGGEENLSEEFMSETGATFCDNADEIASIKEYSGYKARALELKLARERKIAAQKSEEALRIDMLNNPEKYKKMSGEDGLRRDFMDKK